MKQTYAFLCFHPFAEPVSLCAYVCVCVWRREWVWRPATRILCISRTHACTTDWVYYKTNNWFVYSYREPNTQSLSPPSTCPIRHHITIRAIWICSIRIRIRHKKKKNDLRFPNSVDAFFLSCVRFVVRASPYFCHRLLFKWPICHFSISFCWWNGTSGSTNNNNQRLHYRRQIETPEAPPPPPFLHQQRRRCQKSIEYRCRFAWASGWIVCAWMCDPKLIDMNTNEYLNAITFPSFTWLCLCAELGVVCFVNTYMCSIIPWPLPMFGSVAFLFARLCVANYGGQTVYVR